MLTLDNKNKEIEVIEVAIGKKTYKLPLAKYLPYKAIKKLRNKNDLDSILEVISEYIPMDILENLTVDEIGQIITVWGNTSKDSNEENNEELGK